MKSDDVDPRSKRVGWAIIAATVGIPVLLVPLSPVQELPRARIGLAGTLDSPVDEPVTLTVRLPRRYGLSALERREGWPALNDPHPTQIVLDGSPFEVRLPPASYCVTRFWWQDTPPPPLWIALSLSNAPEERYVVWTTRQGADYGVVAKDGTRKTKGEARWRLRLGDYHRDEAGEAWLLDVRLERQVDTGPPGAEKRARAETRGEPWASRWSTPPRKAGPPPTLTPPVRPVA